MEGDEQVLVGIGTAMRITRLVAGILFTSTAIPMILYGLGISAPDVLHWLVSPLNPES